MVSSSYFDLVRRLVFFCDADVGIVYYFPIHGAQIKPVTFLASKRTVFYAKVMCGAACNEIGNLSGAGTNHIELAM